MDYYGISPVGISGRSPIITTGDIGEEISQNISGGNPEPVSGKLLVVEASRVLLNFLLQILEKFH